MATHHALGQKGEQLAIDYLQRKGYKILTTNWRKHPYEIDIIAQDDHELVFIEVKTRSTAFFGEPEESVTLTKQNTLIAGANHYLEEQEIDLDSRFDVIAIVINATTQELRHIEAAFYPSC